MLLFYTSYKELQSDLDNRNIVFFFNLIFYKQDKTDMIIAIQPQSS